MISNVNKIWTKLKVLRIATIKFIAKIKKLMEKIGGIFKKTRFHVQLTWLTNFHASAVSRNKQDFKKMFSNIHLIAWSFILITFNIFILNCVVIFVNLSSITLNLGHTSSCVVDSLIIWCCNSQETLKGRNLRWVWWCFLMVSINTHLSGRNESKLNYHK